MQRSKLMYVLKLDLHITAYLLTFNLSHSQLVSCLCSQTYVYMPLKTKGKTSLTILMDLNFELVDKETEEIQSDQAQRNILCRLYVNQQHALVSSKTFYTGPQ